MFEVAVRAKGKSKEGGGERKRGKVVCRERKGERDTGRESTGQIDQETVARLFIKKKLHVAQCNSVRENVDECPRY